MTSLEEARARTNYRGNNSVTLSHVVCTEVELESAETWLKFYRGTEKESYWQGKVDELYAHLIAICD